MALRFRVADIAEVGQGWRRTREDDGPQLQAAANSEGGGSGTRRVEEQLEDRLTVVARGGRLICEGMGHDISAGVQKADVSNDSGAMVEKLAIPRKRQPKKYAGDGAKMKVGTSMVTA